MDDEFENSHHSNLLIARATGEYNQDGENYYEPRRNQLYWTADATKTLIRLRGERENEFEQSGARKSQIWIEICQKMNEMGFDFTPEKVSKKWHNIMITYNKNIGKKFQSGSVNWEYFELIDAIYKDKRLQNYDDSYQYDTPSPKSDVIPAIPPASHSIMPSLKRKLAPASVQSELSDEVQYFEVEKPKLKINNITSTMMTDIDDPEMEFKKMKFNLDSEFASDDIDQSWWKDYFEKKLELEREKMKKEHERHKENINFQKMALMLQEKVEKVKVDAINNLTNAITKLAESKLKK